MAGARNPSQADCLSYKRFNLSLPPDLVESHIRRNTIEVICPYVHSSRCHTIFNYSLVAKHANSLLVSLYRQLAIHLAHSHFKLVDHSVVCWCHHVFENTLPFLDQKKSDRNPLELTNEMISHFLDHNGIDYHFKEFTAEHALSL